MLFTWLNLEYQAVKQRISLQLYSLSREIGIRGATVELLSKNRLILVAVVRHPANVLSLGDSEHGIISILVKNQHASPSLSQPLKVTLDRYMSMTQERSRSSDISISGESGKDYDEKKYLIWLTVLIVIGMF
ncbi:MAG: hypothetical protein EZS28_026149 [Streblomastix strix]|uniref:Uncharacterized protein n=1 Tax=Streblomastix strix TaxID=222440 RepID=A0A5J4V7B8_9EUKA|nr:MAG: hypothetical protein EZS28_026149 [Streblomastix strix]